MTLVGFFTSSAIAMGEVPISIEVFTTKEFPVRTNINTPSLLVEIYEIDRLARFEAALSDGLTGNPEEARRTAQARLALVLNERMRSVRRAALGLSKAMQYGIDRYPAIVFDHGAVVYGVIDVDSARDQYRQWQETRGR